MQEQWPENPDVDADSIQPSDDVRRQLIARLSRADTLPMIEQLATLIGCAPSADAITEWSAHYPDRWANAVSVFAKLSGYTEKREVAIGVTLDLTRLSDSQLEQRIADQVAKLGLVSPKVVELEPAEYATHKDDKATGAQRAIHDDGKPTVARHAIDNDGQAMVVDHGDVMESAKSALHNCPRRTSQTIEHEPSE